MKKRIIIAAAVICSIVMTTVGVKAFNKGFFDFNNAFNYCQIKMPDGSIVEGTVEKWWDYEDGDQLQVRINGNVYLTHSSNMVLVYKED